VKVLSLLHLSACPQGLKLKSSPSASLKGCHSTGLMPPGKRPLICSLQQGN
jgi:hypothetical protein